MKYMRYYMRELIEYARKGDLWTFVGDEGRVGQAADHLRLAVRGRLKGPPAVEGFRQPWTQRTYVKAQVLAAWSVLRKGPSY
jgi:hypothetical protein